MELKKTYQPNEFEPTIYALWEGAKAFRPSGKGEPFSVVMPPPNANGNLHVGHALTIALEDLMIRYQRMQGKDALYLPGADHAGFETWVVYEKMLNQQGKSRSEFTRERLYKDVWNFVQSQRGNMELQIRALGASCDWEQKVFTLDQKVVDQVYKTFKKLWDDGLIYRGERIVNYSTKFQTSYADIEVDHKEVEGELYHIKYPLIDKPGEIAIATTRPETMFGDVAIAVHPEDERYKDLIGSHALLPIVKREIPIIADDYVDKDYGSGALKITPAHDPNDFEIGKRHQLETLQVIGFDGKMQNVPTSFVGLTPEQARKKVVTNLKISDSLIKVEPIKHVVGFDYKSGLPIEPMVKDQWFLKIRPLAERAKEAILAGQIKFYPESKQKLIVQYLDNLYDWNLSRQITWGMPIPAFVNQDDPNDWIFDTRVDQPTIEVNGQTYLREEDTFDTWFSSGQWPFVTTDYLSGGELARFYPNSVMETGADLLDRWVARMIMLGLYMTDQVPFKEVYMHGMVLDQHSQKMSKSKGNVINPMEMIGKYGSDALRIGLLSNRSAGQNQAFSEDKIIAGRNFCNKLWNISRFIYSQLAADYQPVEAEKIELKSLADHWILAQLKTKLELVNKQIKEYRFSEAVELIYDMIWHDFADWYLEAAKTEPNLDLLVYLLDNYLKIAHPIAPFVTETIWQAANWHDDLLISQAYPEIKLSFEQQKVDDFKQIRKIVEEVRYLNAALPGNKNYNLLFVEDQIVNANYKLIKRLAQLKEVARAEQGRGIKIPIVGHELWLDVDSETLYQHQANLEKRLMDQRATAARLAARLDNQNYLKKAPAALVEQTKAQLTEANDLILRLEKELQISSK